MSGSTDLFWPVACLAAALVLLVVEVFIPSGGLLGLLSLGLILVGLWQAFAISATTGVGLLLALAVLLPLVLAAAVRIWPRTPIGKLLILKPPEPDEIESAATPLEHLLGQYGRTLTPLRPSGLVDFDGRRLDGLSEEGLIPSGTLVQAVQVRGRQIVVRTASTQLLDDFPAS
jgi:membrane-bound ClpP family serine protease